MSNRLWTLPLVVALLIAAAGGAHAIPSLGGPTGIVSLPNADIAPMDELQAAVTYQAFQAAGMYLAESMDMYGASTAANDAVVWVLQAARGVSEEAELWAAYSRVHNGSDSDIWQLGGKVRLEGVAQGNTQVAVGGSIGRWANAFGLPWADSVGMYGSTPAPAVSDLDVFKGYIVATQGLTPIAGWQGAAGGAGRSLIRGSAGFFYLYADSDAAGKDTLLRPFLGVEIDRGLQTLAFEWRWKDADMEHKDVFSAMLRTPLGQGTWLEIGTTNASPIGLGLADQDVFVRIGHQVPIGGAGY